MKTFAKIISVLLHPLLIPTIICGVLILYAPGILPIVNLKGQLGFTFLIFLLTFIFPVFAIYIFFLWNGSKDKHTDTRSIFVKSMLMEAREDRIVPFTITTTLYAGMTYFLIYQVPFALRTLSVIFGSITMCLAIVTFISRYWKISAHSAGIAGSVGFLIGIYLKEGEALLFYPILVFFILTGLLMSARLYLDSHNLLQVLIGGATGFAICLGSMLFFG